jgi:hypothetical protein
MGCHPTEASDGRPSGTPSISFYCDDIGRTVRELSARGVQFTREVRDEGYGLVTRFKMPGDFASRLVSNPESGVEPPQSKAVAWSLLDVWGDATGEAGRR